MVEVIKPPITTIWPSCARTMLSVSEIVLEASGKVNVPPEVPRFNILLTVVTCPTDGRTCRIMSLFTSMRGITSSEIPEKKGCSMTEGVVVDVAPTAEVVVVTPVTKNSSVPTFNMAFWLFNVAMRGLDSTCTLPWDSRKFSKAAKLLL